MKCNPVRRHLLLAALLASPFPLFAREVLDAPLLAPAARGPAIVVAAPNRSPKQAPVWPRPATIPAMRFVPRHDDDRPGRWLEINFSSHPLRLDSAQLEDWQREPLPQRYALEWSHRWTPSVRIGIADAPRGLLPSLEESAWNGYLGQLRREFGPRFQLAVNDDSDARRDAVRILGLRTRVLRYDLAPETPDQLPHRVVQIAVATARGVLVFGCEGPPRAVAEIDFAFESLVVRAEFAP